MPRSLHLASVLSCVVAGWRTPRQSQLVHPFQHFLAKLLKNKKIQLRKIPSLPRVSLALSVLVMSRHSGVDPFLRGQLSGPRSRGGVVLLLPGRSRGSNRVADRQRGPEPVRQPDRTHAAGMSVRSS